MVHSPLGLDMRLFLIIILLVLHMSGKSAHADVYVDVGVAYIDEVDVITSGRVDLFGYEIEAEYTSNLVVEGYVPMLRVGYTYRGDVGIFNGLSIEYDAIGSPSVMIPRVNVFYRFTFK